MKGNDTSGWNDATWELLLTAIKHLEAAWRQRPFPCLVDFLPVECDDPRRGARRSMLARHSMSTLPNGLSSVIALICPIAWTKQAIR